MGSACFDRDLGCGINKGAPLIGMQVKEHVKMGRRNFPAHLPQGRQIVILALFVQRPHVVNMGIVGHDIF